MVFAASRRRPDADAAEQLYVLTLAIVGVIRAWAMEGGGEVSAQTLELELTELVRGYVQHCLTRAYHSHPITKPAHGVGSEST